MSDRRDFYFRQLVTEAHVDGAFDAVEQADRDIMVDAGIVGITSGLTVVQHSGTPDLTVDVGAGAAYDQTGQRMAVAALQNVNVATDSIGAATAVAGVGNERWVSIFLRFARTLSDPQLDGNNVTIFFVRDESFTIERVQGAEAAIGAAVRPALGVDKILLADIQRTNGQTQVLTANISTTRREMAYKFTSGAFAVAAGTAEESCAAILAAFNTFVATTLAGTGTPDGATQVGARAVGSLAAGTVRSQLNELDTDLQSLTAATLVSLAGKANLTGGNSFIGAQGFSSTVDIDGNATLGGDLTFDKAGAFVLQWNNSVTTLLLRHNVVFGTGANNGQDIVVRTQPGQAQTGGADNNHSGNFEILIGERGQGGSGAEGRTGGALLRTENDGNGCAWSSWIGRSVAVASGGGTVTVFEFDAAYEGTIVGSAGNLFDVTVRILAVETTGGTPLVQSLEVESTFRHTGGVMTQIGTTTLTGHNKGNLTGLTCNVDSTGANSKFRVTVASATTNCRARAFVNVRQTLA